MSKKPITVPTSPVELSPIKAVEIAASRLPDVVSLAQGIPSFDTPQPIKDFVAQRIEEGACARYSLSPGLPELRELISNELADEGMQYDPDGEVLVTCGAIEAIAATLLAFVGGGDEVLVASPTYASYIPAIQLAGARPRFVALDEDRNFDLDPDAFEQQITNRTRAILLCNPNNPTGTVYSVAQTERLMELAGKHGLLVITDEVYKDFVYSKEAAGNPAKIAGHRDRVIRVCSFSKAFGMTGWRVGFLHGDRALVNAILAVHDTIVTCAPVVSQYGAIAALRFGAPFVQQFRREFRARRDRVVDRLDALDRVFDYQMPNASYFAFPRVKDTVPLARDSRALAEDILHKVRVALVPGVAFGPTGEAHLRFCYAREPRDIDRAFDRLGDYFEGRHPQSVPAAQTPAPTTTPFRRAGQATLRSLARLRLSRQRPRVVAIAGGRGKTVLKRTLTELLSGSMRVNSNPLSHNTEIGLALAVLETRLPSGRLADVAQALGQGVANAVNPTPFDVLVVELGVGRDGDMDELLSIVCPDLAIITPLATGAVADLDLLETMRREMRVLTDRMRNEQRPVFVCRDDPLLDELTEDSETHTFGLEDMSVAAETTTLCCGDESYEVNRDMVGDTATRAVAASVLVARVLGVTDDAIREFLAPRP